MGFALYHIGYMASQNIPFFRQSEFEALNLKRFFTKINKNCLQICDQMYHSNLEPPINPENMFLSHYILALYICLTFLVRVGYLGTRPELKMLASQDRVR